MHINVILGIDEITKWYQHPGRGYVELRRAPLGAVHQRAPLRRHPPYGAWNEDSYWGPETWNITWDFTAYGKTYQVKYNFLSLLCTGCPRIKSSHVCSLQYYFFLLIEGVTKCLKSTNLTGFKFFFFIIVITFVSTTLLKCRYWPLSKFANYLKSQNETSKY